MCKVSIIVPLYNGEKTVGRCLDSLLNQTIHDIEIIVVDDGSKDNGVSVVKQYIKEDSRVRLVCQKNSGAGTARNRGIKEATGKFVGFVDCDDFVDRQMYEIMVSALEKEQVSIAVCQEKNIYIEEGIIHTIGETRYPISKNTVYSAQQVLDWFLNFSYLSLNSMCYKVVKRSVFLDHNIMEPENFRYAEDMVTSAALFSCVDKVVIIPNSFYYYVHEKNSTSYNYTLQHAIDVYYDWKDVKKYLSNCNYNGSIDNFSLGMKFTSLKQLYWAQNKEEQRCAKAKRLKIIWKKERKNNSWKPVFKKTNVPMAHKIKICVSYFNLEKVMCFLIKQMRWIPFFNYMT